MVRTKKILSVILAIMMLMQTFVITNFAADIEGFTDFPTNSWSTEAMTAAVENGLLGFNLFRSGNQFFGGDGIVKKGVERTIESIARLANEGMKETDKEILKIMLSDK